MQRIPEREAAKAAGERYYFTGKPCRNGHIEKRYTASGGCCICMRRNTKASTARAPWPIERQAAKDAGLRHYVRSKPCPNGHENKYFVKNGSCVQCSVERCARWNAKNPGHMAAGARRRRAADPTGHRAEVKRWRDQNPEKVKAALAAWQKANREHRLAYNNAYVQNRRAVKAKNGGSYTPEDVANLMRLQNGCCAACKTNERKLEVDHVVPVVKGGSNDPSNLQLLCGPCNKSKGSRDFEEWAASKGYILD